MNYQQSIHDLARGRWRALLPGVGIGTKFLSGRHGPCPMCGGKDRWRFDDKQGDGRWFCTHCGSGTGVDLVMHVKGTEFFAAKKWIESQLGSAPVNAPKSTPRIEATKDQLSALWGRGTALDGADVASRYLAGRKLSLTEWPAPLRYIADLPWRGEDGSKALYPAMLAKYAAPDGKSATLHRTYLAEPGTKAPVEQPRKLMPGRIPSGSAVRLAAPAETMGIAEGIETALSAAALHEVPVWAALTAGAMVKWNPPEGTKCVLIFGDNDRSFAGQNAAYALGYRLVTQGYTVEVRVPDEPGSDWNDVLQVGEAQDADRQD